MDDSGVHVGFTRAGGGGGWYLNFKWKEERNQGGRSELIEYMLSFEEHDCNSL